MISRALLVGTFLACSVGIGLGLGGCDTVKAPGTVGLDPLAPNMYSKIAVLQGLSGFIVMGTEPRVNVGPPMAVTCALRAKTDFEELSVQYRYIWFTSAGVPLNGDPDWQYLRMQSRVESFFSGNALDRTAVDWRLEIRPAR